MKEQFRPVQGDLTNQVQNPYSRGGEYFMPEPGQTEGPPGETSGPQQKPVSPERVELVRRAWEVHNAGRELDPDERETQEMAIQMGRAPPMEEGAEETAETFTDPHKEVKETLGIGPRNEGYFDKKYVDTLVKLYSQKEVWEELHKDNPDFTSPQLASLRDFIEKTIKPTDREFVHFADLITRTREVDGTVISETSKKVLFEWLLERIISIPDLTPEAHYRTQLASLYLQNNKDALITTARSYFDSDFVQYLSQLAHVREVAHDLNISLRYGDQYKEYVSSALRTAGLDFIHNTLVGVNTVVRLYEKISARKIADKRTWFSEGDIKEIEGEVKKIFDAIYASNLVTKNERKLTEWEKDRALKIGRIFFAGTQRMAMYASFGNIPPDAVVTERIGSLPYEYIARSLVPFKMIAARFFGGDQKSGSHRLLKEIFKEQEEIEDKNYIELFGLDKKTIMVNSYGARDPESYSWRTQLMFLGNIKIEIGGREISLLEYLNRELEKAGSKVADPLLGGGLEKKEKEAFSRAVEDIVLGQRLYFSVLTQYGNFDSELKEKIWRKIAILKPSTVASLLPEVIGENKSLWESLKYKLYIAEEIRIQRDSEKYKRALTQEELKLEARRDNKNELLEEGYFSEKFGNQLTEEEKELLKEIIEKGYGRAGELAKAEMPFVFAIDDTPVIAWKKTGEGMGGLADEDLLRILVSDQKNISDAWGEMNFFIESPAAAGVIEHFAKAVDGIANVLGRKTAQDIIEPFITAYIKLASTDPKVLWFPGGMTLSRLMRNPTSEIEKYFRNTFVSFDEKERADFLQALSQVKAIRDNVVDSKDGLTQLDKISKETKSNRMWLFLRFLRIILMLLGPAVAFEFLRIVLPEELEKALR